MDPGIRAQLFVIVVIYLRLIACSMVFRKETDNGSDLVDACLDNEDFKIDHWVTLFLNWFAR
jgi:hypothetical protein